MGPVKMSQDINHDRRRFLGTAAMTLAAAQLGMIGSADAQSGTTIPADATSITLGTIKPMTAAGPHVPAAQTKRQAGHVR